MAKLLLNQVIALSNGLKERSKKRQTTAYHKLQKEGLITGISRTYRPKDDEDKDILPPERKYVQFTVEEALIQSETALIDLFNMIATLDSANCEAKADVIVDEATILSDVPVTHLLFLEKQILDLRTQLGKLPTLDPAENWEWSNEADAFKSDMHETTRSRRIRKNHVKAEATKEHPAQVEIYTEDVIVGTWETIIFSGAIPESEKQAIADRVDKLLDAVKCAREKANSLEIQMKTDSIAIFNYVLRG